MIATNQSKPLSNAQHEIRPTNQYFDIIQKSVKSFPIIGKMCLLFYFIAYYYVMMIYESHHHYFPFTIVIIAFAETLYHRVDRTWSPFTPKYRHDLIVIISMMLLQGLAISLWGFHPQFEAMQFIVLHLSFVLYIAMRSHHLVDQQLSLWVLFDGLNHLIWVPFSNLMIRPIILWYHRDHLTQSKFKPIQWLAAIISIISLVFILVFVIYQLGQLSPAFEKISNQLLSGLYDFILQFNQLDKLYIYFGCFIWSIPVGLWLTGLIFGSLLSKENPSLKTKLLNIKTKIQIFPKTSALLLMGILTGLYCLFFITAFNDLIRFMSVSYIEAPDASEIAVSGFWQFIRITLINLGVTWLIQWLYDTQWVKTKMVQLEMLSLYAFSLIFASLAAWKIIGIYVLNFGWTPLRLLSGWFATLMVCAMILIIIQHFIPKFNAYRWIILIGIISFTAICFAFPFLI